MKVEYRGFVLAANREKTNQGIYKTFYSAQQKESKLILTEGNDAFLSIQDAIEDLKYEVDQYLKPKATYEV